MNLSGRVATSRAGIRGPASGRCTPGPGPPAAAARPAAWPTGARAAGGRTSGSRRRGTCRGYSKGQTSID